ncbi:MAG: efflux RND transporter permease subunit [candidate division Zixibacteria bacterium]|nr:efflux RND transporter permease subunit [candidate division Zixibacteria bacterium]
MYKLARFSVQYPTTILMAVLAIILLGYISFQRLGMDLLPDLNSPRLFIEVNAGERPPEEMETQFVSQLESVAARGRKVENVSSISRVGQALITVEYSWDADMDEAFLDLQKTIADFSQNSNADQINVTQHDPNALPMLVVAFSQEESSDLDKLRRTAENNIANELIRLPGIAEVKVIGSRQREAIIRTDAYTLEAYGLTLDQLASQIQSSNRNMTGGSIVEMGLRYVIRGVGEFESLDDIENLIVSYKASSGSSGSDERIPIYLREVADVSFELSEPENLIRFNGVHCLGLEIYKEAKYNTIDAAESAHEQLEILRRSLSGYNLFVVQDQARFIKSSVTEVEQTGLLGILLAVIVLFVFLRRIGVTSVISIAIPISVVATFNLMYFNDLSLNIMTLGGLALGAGMLVDNAIVVMENIFRHLEAGKPLKEAAMLGAGEVGGAITSATITTIIVFFPIVYLHGAAGELFREQALTVAFSLISSLFVALAVIPMLCSKLLKSEKKFISTSTVSFPGYENLLRRIIKRRYIVIFIGAGLIAITLFFIPMVGSEFMPRADQGELYIELTLPEGTNLDRTAGTVRNLESIITKNYGDDILQIYTKVGPAGASTTELDALTDENNAVIHIVLNDNANTYTSQMAEGITNLMAGLPNIDAQIILEQTALQATLGTTTAPMVVEIKGDDLDVLSDICDTVKARLQPIESLSNIETSFQEGRPEINLVIDRTIASQFSLNAQQIGSQLTDLLSGRDAGTIEYLGEYTDIKIKRPDVSLTDLQNILLESSSGRRVRLDEVTRVEKSFAAREIIRNNQARIAHVTAHITGDATFDKVAASVDDAIESISLPPEYSFDITGEEKLRQEAFGNLLFALLLAIILVYMVMASQFESLIHPFVILLTIPLATVGAVFLLLITGIPFNIMSYIGIIMLAGIAVNDSIILVDRINQNRRAGMPLTEAIVNAGQTRIRPIIMTSVTTILALLPLTLGIGEGASLRAPMAVAVIGGLFSSTALTLLIIPSVYYVIAGKFKVRLDKPENNPV